MRRNQGWSVLGFVLLAGTSVMSQEVVIISHKDNPILSRIDVATSTFISGGQGKQGLEEVIQWPSIAAPQKLFTSSYSGSLHTCSTTLSSFQPMTAMGTVQGIGAAQASGVVSHIAVVGQTSGNATSASFFELKDPDNDASLDQFVSSDDVSNWTDVAFASNGSTIWKYGIVDLRGTATSSYLHVVDVTNYRSIAGGIGGIDPGFDPNANDNGPPYSALPAQFASMPTGVRSDYSFVAEKDLFVDTFTSTTTGNRYFVVATSNFDCSPATGIQYGLSIRVYNASAAVGAPLVGALGCFGYVTNLPNIANMRVFGNFAIITEEVADGNGNPIGNWYWINLLQWEAGAWGAVPGGAETPPPELKGLDGIGTNLNQSHLYIGSVGFPIGAVLDYPVNFSAPTGTPITAASSTIDLLTTQEKNSINPPARPYPKVFSAVDLGATNATAPWFDSSSSGGGSGGCSATSGLPSGTAALLPVILLALAVFARKIMG